MASAGDRKASVAIVNVANGGRIVAPSRPIPGVARPRPTAEISGDPTQLSRYLADLDARIEELSRLTAANLFSSGVHIRNISMVGGVVQLIEHRLRRDYVGWVITRYRGNVGDVPAIPIEVTLPTGRSASQWIYLQTERDATLDILVF